MADIILHAPEGRLTLVPTLSLVEALEKDTSLLKTAERLLSRDLKISEILPLLHICYRAAGCTAADADLDAFLLERAPGLMLAEILVALIAPLAGMGAASPGEAA